MITAQRHQLLQGEFSPSEAATILLSLVKSKIDFHNLEKVSNEERFGRDISHSERRLVELRKLYDTLRIACESAAENGQRMRLNGWIEVELVSTERP